MIRTATRPLSYATRQTAEGDHPTREGKGRPDRGALLTRVTKQTDSRRKAATHEHVPTHGQLAVLPYSRRTLGGTAMNLTRRELLKAGVFGGAVAALPVRRAISAQTRNRLAASALPQPFTIPFAVPPIATPIRSDDTFDYYRIVMQAVQTEIIPGYQTTVYAYNGSVPGPTIRATQGRRTAVRFVNELPSRHATLRYEPFTSVHLHGSPSAPEYDGYASDITRPGQYKDYFYDNTQCARTMWYHDHGVHHTAQNVTMGLAAMYLTTDSQEALLPLPKGEFDVPLMIGDRMFTSNGEFLFSLDDESGMYGDVNLVNGRPWPLMQVKKRKYRFRMLNASVSRSYELFLDSGDPLVVIATDGGLAPAPIPTRRLRIGNAERYDVIVDFSRFAPGTKIRLMSRSPKNNEDFEHTDKVMQFEVVGDAFDPSNNAVPDALNPLSPVMALQPAQSVRTRQMVLNRANSNFTINGNTWDRVIRSNFAHVEADPTFGTAEIWEFRNLSGGWFHPMHIHLVDFKVLDRNGQPPRPYERGPKDTVYVGENETVRVLMRFEGLGKYMIHCHNVIHEDHDMMSQYEVKPASPDAPPVRDPLSERCKDLPEEPNF